MGRHLCEFKYSTKKLSETFELYGLVFFSVVEFVEPFDSENSDIMDIQVDVMWAFSVFVWQVVIVQDMVASREFTYFHL